MENRNYNWITTACIGAMALFCSGLAIFTCVMANKLNTLQDRYDKMYDVTATLAREIDRLEAKTEDMYDEIDALGMKLNDADKNETEYVIDYDYEYVLRVVAAECRGEPLDGIMAVAQVIRERADTKGKTPEEIVKEKLQFAAPTSMENVNANVLEACRRVLLEGESVTDKPIKYFYSTKNGFVSATHEKKTYVMTIGYHKFFMD